ncbi:unnamed protein product [Phyllotreta striolata]|uniref:Fe2OG dioxygenase domain-containing protein n=1 Tax=Phyllotreta striolata TaxID=444603 RepID=A0A9N9TRY8_PHYSR|nr:unnamed protein product [Phyllotreta striolata]
MTSPKVTRRHKESQSTDKNKEKPAPNKTDDESKEKRFKYGPLPSFANQRVWSRGILLLGVVIYILYFSKSTKETVLAKQSEVYIRRSQNVECSKQFLEDIQNYKGCVPQKCGRFVSDKLVTSQEADILLKLAIRVMAQGGSSGGASIMDLHTGALSFNDKFINVYAHNGDNNVLTPEERKIYQLVRKKIQTAIADAFRIEFNSLHLTYPTFFSRLTNVEPKTRHDEYWHEHVDKRTYESFHYTSLLYLNDYNKDFKGGRFVFMDDIDAPSKNVTVEPKKGRVLMFTSGYENPHFVERVQEGSRFAITVSFTCDATKAIQDPKK